MAHKYLQKMLFCCRNNFLRIISTQNMTVRFKHKPEHWSVQVKKKHATDKALEHFDDFYKKVYGSSWPSIRQGLLSDRHKYVAVVNNYSDTERIMETLENGGAINMRTLFNVTEQNMKETQRANQRTSTMEQAFRLDRETPHPKRTLRSEEGEQREAESTHGLSLGENLKNAEYDLTRIIRPNVMELSPALYEYVPVTRIKGKEDWIPETHYYKHYDRSDEMQAQVEKEHNLHFPDHLNVYCHEQDNHSRFDGPQKGSTGVSDYYLLDGGSLLPVLALGLRPGDKVLDMCCSPGGKTFIALQTLYPDRMVCNDVDGSRVKRIYSVLRQYLYDLDKRWLEPGKIQVTKEHGEHMSANGFDCVLVDVPCTNDRLSLHQNDNNWFKASRVKERLQLPQAQAALLSNALKLVKVGGHVVYSTCSLSPIQNDGVVHMALKRMWEETTMKFIVKDLSPALRAAQCVYKFANPQLLRYGHLILPNQSQNYGPTYFCKLKRLE